MKKTAPPSPPLDLSRKQLLLVTVSHVLDLDEPRTRALFDTILIHKITPTAVDRLKDMLEPWEFRAAFDDMLGKEKDEVYDWIVDAVAQWVLGGGTKLAKKPGGTNLWEILNEILAKSEGGFSE